MDHKMMEAMTELVKVQHDAVLLAERTMWLERQLRVRGYQAAPYYLTQARLELSRARVSLEQAIEQMQADRLAAGQLDAGAKVLMGVML